ncbi:MAG: transposase [Immundisolibacter sp.]|uniref:transposase n=1 Tax=Immundisolibacter sp. TaxID=1934948 RepID=UPI003EE25948
MEHCALHAYALMTNHVHLLITPDRADAIPRLTIALGRRYVQYINTTYRRSGTLWDSRYKSSLIQAETYLRGCQRYIEPNPVPASMVDDPAHDCWTSYRHNALGPANPYLTPHELYLAIGRDDAERQVASRELFRTQLDNETVDDIRLALNQSQPLGNSGFHARIEATTGQRREARPRGRPPTGDDASLAPDGAQAELGLC